MLPNIIQDRIHELGLGQVKEYKPVSGGCINQCYEIRTSENTLFLKYHESLGAETFKAEADALDLLRQQSHIKIPTVLAYDNIKNFGAFLILEWLPLRKPNAACQAALGHGLALLHQNITSKQFGLSFDNAIGATPQINSQTNDWVAFFQNHRFGYIVDKVLSRYPDTELQTLCAKLFVQIPNFFQSVEIIPSLLHGDLWGGNFACTLENKPAIFDPASYFGHHEAELGMMYMFGGFSEYCFTAYHEIIPKADGFDQRNLIYQLYHVLNHYYLFGPSYRSQALSIIKHIQ